MKSSTIKFLILGITMVMFFSVMTMPVNAESEYENVILKKADNEFMVYYNDICNDIFQFAISNDSSTDEANLNYTSSVKDKVDDGALNVAFIDDTNNPENKDEVYIWIKDDEDNVLISGEKIDLREAIDDEKLNLINTTTIANNDTSRIKVDTTQTQTRNVMVDGVDTTVTTGKIVIDGKDGAKYYYELLNANDTASDARKLYDMADKINNYSGDTYGKLKLAKEFIDLYTGLMPQDSDWTEVENNEIMQPEDTVTGDKYVVYIKEVAEDGTEIVDVKLLECIRKEDQGKNQKEETVTEVVKSPVTYDSIALIIAFVVIVLAIIIVAILKVKSNRKSDN